VAFTVFTFILDRKQPWIQRVFVEEAINAHAVFKQYPHLASATRSLLDAAWEHSTWSTYSSAVHAYFNFCAAHGIASPFPPTPSSLIGWAVYDFKIRQLAASSVKQYVTSAKSVCRILDVESLAFSSFQLHYVLRGMAKICPRRFITSPRLPITIWLLAAMFEKMATPLTRLMRTIKAALSSGVYGMLRSAEFLAKGINPCPLARADLKWLSQVVEVRLRFTKGDIYHTGVVVKLFKNGSATCPYTLLKEAWDIAPFKSSSSPVFQNDDGSALSYKTVQEVLSLLAVALGLDPDTFKLHGLRIGGATSLAILGMPPHIIKTIGRWKSICYQIYTRTSQQQLFSVSQALGRASSQKSEDDWFGGLPRDRRSTACSWAVDDLQTVASTAGLPGGELAGVRWNRS
jgi:hypothetical protein